MAAQFQDDNLDGRENRTFIQFAETVNRGLTGFGQSVDRVYEDSPVTTPAQFNDGTALPAALQMPTFAWDGDGADVTAAWNEGRYLMIHRDHGWSDGWSHPGFNTANVQALTNGANLPVLMSINCSSAAFDYDETSFVSEALVNPNGGAVGCVRRHPRLPDLAQHADRAGLRRRPAAARPARRGPGHQAAHGQRADPRQDAPGRPGAAIRPRHHRGRRQHPKRALPVALLRRPDDADVGRRPRSTSSPSVFTAVFKRGDRPAATRPPAVLGTGDATAQFNGQAFSLLRNGVVIGKGVAVGRLVEHPRQPRDSADTAGQLEVALEADGSPPVRLPVTDEPPLDTSLTQQCPKTVDEFDEPPFTVTGQLDPGSPVRRSRSRTRRRRDYPGPHVRAPRHDGRERRLDGHDRRDCRGAGPTYNTFGDWKVQARYEGDSDHGASIAPECTVNYENSG